MFFVYFKSTDYENSTSWNSFLPGGRRLCPVIDFMDYINCSVYALGVTGAVYTSSDDPCPQQRFFFAHSFWLYCHTVTQNPWKSTLSLTSRKLAIR
jgi:hypothetical protein